MREKYQTWHGTIALFVVLLAYFITTYKFNPGLEFTVSGQLESDLPARILWDYGNGYDNRHYVEVELSAGRSDSAKPLGNILIEPAGFKDEKSRGYLAWIVVPAHYLESESYVLTGRHHWGTWFNIGKRRTGRQLALFPGSSIQFKTNKNSYVIYQFKAPQAGYVKVTSDSGPERYYNGYGKNPNWDVNTIYYRESLSDKIRFVSLPFQRQKTWFTLPNHHIKSLRLETSSDQVNGAEAFDSLKILHPAGINAASGGPVVLQDIHINGRSIARNEADVRLSISRGDNNLILEKAGDAITIEGAILSYDIYFADESEVDSVEILQNGTSLGLKQATEQHKNISITGSAPLKWPASAIESCRIKDTQGVLHTFVREGDDPLDAVEMSLQSVAQSKFSPLLLSIQVLLAACIAGLFHMVQQRLINLTSTSHSGFVKQVFIENRRWLFWTFLVCGIGVNFLYLAAEWPGSMTPDSIFVHQEIKKLRITNHHPYSYSLLVLALHNIWDAPVVNIFLQIFTFHLLSSYFFYFLYTRGLKLYIIIPCFLLVLFSFPINLYNITIWKDIPFTTLVLFWALFLTYLYYLRIYEKIRVSYGLGAVLLLSILFLLLLSLRHNGIVYLPFIPIMLLLFCRAKPSWFTKFCILSGVLCVLYYLIFPDYVLFKKPKLNNFAKHTISRSVNELSSITEEDQKEYYLEHYLGDRTREFVGTLGTSPKALAWMNDMREPPQRWFSYDQAKADMVTRPASEALASVLGKILKTTEYTGIDSGRFIFWNSSFALVALIIIFFLYKWLPLSAFYSFFFLYQTVGMYFVVWERWRYLYYLYLAGLFLVPIVLFEIYKLRNKDETYHSSTLL